MKIKKVMAPIILLALAGVGAYYGNRHGLWQKVNGLLSHKAAGQTQYYCPMHPTYVSDRPGDCPICNMRLIPMEKVTPAGDHAGPPPATGEAKDEAVAESSSQVSGYVPVKIPRERQQVMGITVEEARMMNLNESLRTVGRIVSDETRLHHVHTKFEGFIEHLFVNYVGQFVKKGEPLFSIYSPELVATQNEYLLALQAQEKFDGKDADGPLTGIDLLGAARRRLSLWDIGSDTFAELEKTHRPVIAVIIRSPASGFVSVKNASHGMRITPADNLYDIIDLSSVWVLADLYEVTLPFVHPDQPAEMTLAYQPDQVWKGRVTYMYPTVDEKTRTLKVRLEFNNPSGRLRPGMYVNVELKGRLGSGLAVPESAVLSTGERTLVFVAKPHGIFEPREVTTGVKVRNFYEIKRGLSVGEKVVTSANFLVDSESKLLASRAGMGAGHKHGQ
ncbi:MAG: efflux RND transporter periplasmic adaptor subunit [Acidobacteria bacterium]|nr:efflux RND transporter periplasmic adaptor subunit [Acidobacteriota bacterium]MBI3656659.1 efflux RND transporter periplasmic adaptor subunit [Acidobacteriota bacterium]